VLLCCEPETCLTKSERILNIETKIFELKFKSTFCGGVVGISIGPNATPFEFAHLKLLSDCSTVFKTFFEKGLLSMDFLDHEDPDIFTEFLRWAYRGKIFEETTPTWMQLCQLWLLAEKLEVPKLQSLVMDHCQCRSETDDYDNTDTSALMAESTVMFVYSKTAVGNPFRRIAVDSWRTVAGKTFFESVREKLPREFAKDLCLRFFEYRDAGLWSGVNTPPPTDDES
jgi:hypothetical protein